MSRYNHGRISLLQPPLRPPRHLLSPSLPPAREPTQPCAVRPVLTASSPVGHPAAAYRRAACWLQGVRRPTGPPSAAWSNPDRELLATLLQPARGRPVQVDRGSVQVLEEHLAKPAPASTRLPVPAAPTSLVLCSCDRDLGMPMGL